MYSKGVLRIAGVILIAGWSFYGWGECLGAAPNGMSYPFLDTFELDTEGYTLTGLWHLEAGCADDDVDHGSDGTLYFGGAGNCGLGSDNIESGTATSPLINYIPGGQPTLLVFQYFLGTDTSGVADVASVSLSTDGINFTTVANNTNFTPINKRLCDNTGDWLWAAIDVSSLMVGTQFYVRFYYDSIDGAFSVNPGFYVDNIRLQAFPVDCTLSNPDFEWDDQSWTRSVVGSSGGWEVREAGDGAFANSIPSSGTLNMGTDLVGTLGSVEELWQEVTLPALCDRVFLSWTDRVQWDLQGGGPLATIYEVTVEPSGGGTPLATLYSASVAPDAPNNFDSGNVARSLFLSDEIANLPGQTVRLVWRAIVGSEIMLSQIDVDNICVSTSCGTALSGSLTGSSPHWNRPNEILTVSSDCSGAGVDASNSNMPYAVYDIQTKNGAAPFLAEVLRHGTTINDTMLFLYCEAFDPLTPLVNLVAADDDGGIYRRTSRFKASDNILLVPDTTYKLVITTFNTNDTDLGAYQLCISDDFYVGDCGPFEVGGRIKATLDDPDNNSILINMRGTLVCQSRYQGNTYDWLVRWDDPINFGHNGLNLCTDTGTQGWYMKENQLAVTCDEISIHSADKDQNHSIGLSELLRVIQYFNIGSLHCDPLGEDGYNPGAGDQLCTPHSSDYNTQNWMINLNELLRVIQFFNIQSYYFCPGVGEDTFCPGVV